MLIERTDGGNDPVGDVGGKVVGLCLLKADKLLYMDLSIFWKQC